MRAVRLKKTCYNGLLTLFEKNGHLIFGYTGVPEFLDILPPYFTGFLYVHFLGLINKRVTRRFSKVCKGPVKKAN